MELLTVVVCAEAQSPQGLKNLVVADFDARVPVHIGFVKAQGDLGVPGAVYVCQTGDHLGVRIDVQQQL